MQVTISGSIAQANGELVSLGILLNCYTLLSALIYTFLPLIHISNRINILNRILPPRISLHPTRRRIRTRIK